VHHNRYARSILSAAAFALGAARPATAATRPASADSLLPRDTSLHVETLANGMRVFLRHSVVPANRVELRLVVAAGSAYEDEDQRGLAHLVEHLAFAGTTHFPNRTLIPVFGTLGMRFGNDVNAATVYDATMYSLSVAADSADIATALVIMTDWAHGVTFDSTVIARERSIVQDELRMRFGAGVPYTIRMDSVMYAGSPYATRQPIGDSAIVATAPVATIRRFYEDWYRPERMSVVVVGDVDVDRMARLLRQTVGAIPPSATPARRPPVLDIPVTSGPRAVIMRDALLDDPLSARVDLVVVDPRVRHDVTMHSLRSSIIEGIYFAALRARLANDAGEGRPVGSMGVDFSDPVTVARVFDLHAQARPVAADSALAVAINEVVRAARDGFSADELTRAKAATAVGYDHLYAERDRWTSEQLAAAFVDIARSGGLVPTPQFMHDQAMLLLGTSLRAVSSAEVAAYGRHWADETHWILIAGLPRVRDAGTSRIGTFEMRAIADSIARTGGVARTRGAPPAPVHVARIAGEDSLLVRVPPVPGRVVRDSTIAGTGVRLWTLSNGVRVFLKPTAFDPDQLEIQARAPGGISLAADSEYPSLQLVSPLFRTSGVGGYSKAGFRERSAGTQVDYGVGVDQASESIGARGAPRDAALMLQLLYAEFRTPRFDSAMEAPVLSQLKASLTTGMLQFGAVQQFANSNGNPRGRPPTVAMMDSAHAAVALAFWRARLANASNWTFYIVGAFKPDSLRPLVERYLGSLPAGQPERWHDWKIWPPASVGRVEIPAGPAGQTTVHLSYVQPLPNVDRESSMAIQVVALVLERRLRTRLREEMGGTYSPQVSAGSERWPAGRATLDVQFDAAPERAEALTQAALAVMDTLRMQGPTDVEVHEVVEAMRQSALENQSTNAVWLQRLMDFDWNEWPMDAGMSDPGVVLGRMTPALVHAAAQAVINPKQYYVFAVTPYAGASAGTAR
jgi:zinc protease